MPLKQSTTDFLELAKSDGIRLWLPFLLPELTNKYVKLTSFLSTYESGSRPKGGISDEGEGEAISLGGEQINTDGTIDLSKIPYVSHKFYKKSDKGRVKHSDILICKDGALTGKTCFVDFDVFPSKEVMVNEHVYILRGNESISQKFLFYLTTNNLFQSQVKNLAYRKKAQPGLNLDHLRKIKIPLIPKPRQEQIVAQIEPIEKKVKELKEQITPPPEIINKVFAREFNFDENLFNEFGKGMTAGTQIAQNRILRVFETGFEELSRSGIVRFSTRFHNTPTKKLMDFMDSIETLQVKDVLESYEKGIQPIYNPDGEIPVVKIANLKNGYINFFEPEFITQEYYNNLAEKKKLKQGDVIICATGKISLGKVDYYDYEQESITTVDNYILRLKENYSPLFFTYFFRSILGYFQIERDFTGATNQIHLYWEQISNFQIPNILLKAQQKIVGGIKAELDKQEVINKKIQTERNKIDEIIEKAIK